MWATSGRSIIHGVHREGISRRLAHPAQKDDNAAKALGLGASHSEEIKLPSEMPGSVEFAPPVGRAHTQGFGSVTV